MELGCISVPLELKFAGDEKPAGYFEGYGAVFGNIDRGGDMIEPAAFAKSLSQMAMGGIGLPPMYYNHDRSGGTIGVWESVKEDGNGLAVKGRLIGLDTDQGKMTLARAREGACKGLSIGYRVPPNGSRKGSGRMGEPARVLKQIDLKEISLVDDPMNPAARLNFVKSARLDEQIRIEEIKTVDDLARFIEINIGSISEAIARKGWRDAIRDYEKLILRDGGNFSNAAAKSIAIGGFKAQTEPRDEDDIGEHIRQRFSALASVISK